jgi:2-phospho-L-lactate guanylyltransferase
MEAEITVAEREPAFTADPGRQLECVVGLVADAPASLLVEQIGERVQDGVEVGRDLEAEDLEVVSDVDDRSNRVRARRSGERVDAARAPKAPAEDGYAHRVLAIVPFRGLDGAKSRLAPVLSPEERARLAAEMLERVLDACANASSIEQTLLVTPHPGLEREGLDVLLDEGTGHADAVTLALADQRARSGVIVVMADCPLVTPESLDALIEAARPLALVPARDGGVNALVLRQPDAFSPTFGVPAEETIAVARAAGLAPVIVEDERLSIDVDRPEDLALA